MKECKRLSKKFTFRGLKQMTSSDSLATTIERLQSLLQLPPKQLQKRAYRQLVEEELRQTEVDLFHLLNEHGVKSALELDQ